MRNFKRDLDLVSRGASPTEYYATFCSLEAKARDDARVENCQFSSPDVPDFTIDFSFTRDAGEINFRK